MAPPRRLRRGKEPVDQTRESATQGGDRQAPALPAGAMAEMLREVRDSLREELRGAIRAEIASAFQERGEGPQAGGPSRQAGEPM